MTGVVEHLEAGHRVESDVHGTQTWRVNLIVDLDEQVGFWADDKPTVFTCETCRIQDLEDDREI